MFTVLVSIVVTLFVAVQDPIVQRFAVRFLGGYLSEKTGADIKVGRIAVSPNLRVYVDDVSVKDLNGNDLAKIGKLRTKFHVGDLLEGKIHLGHVELSDTDANLIQYEGEDGFNFKFLADFFASDKEKDPNKESVPIFIDRISLKNINFQLWNQNEADSTKTANNAIDYAHLKLENLNFEARHFALVGDSVYAVVEKLAANEHCGLELKHFQSDVVFCQQGIFLKDMQMETNNSLFHMDLDMKYDGFEAFSDFVNKVEFDAKIYPTDVLLSDIGYFAPVMYKMPNRVHLECDFSGPIEHFSVKDMDLSFGKMTSIRGDISMHPLDFDDGYHTMNIKNLRFSYDDLVNFYIPGSSGMIPLPESLSTLESGNIKLNFKGSYNNFNSDLTLASGIGNLSASVARSNHGDGDNVFSGHVNAEDIDAGHIANASKVVGKLSLAADFSANLPSNGEPELIVNGKAYHAQLLGNHIDEIMLDGDLKENQFVGKINIDDDDLNLDFNGMIDFRNNKQPKSDFVAVVRHANLRALDIMKDSISEVSTTLYVNMTGFDLDDLEGMVHLDSTTYRDGRGEYFMKSFDASIVNDDLMQRRIKINNDFFDFEMAGKMNFASLIPVLNEYGDSFVHFPIWQDKNDAFQKYKLTHDVEQDFILNLNLKNTETLCRMFVPSLKVAPNTRLNGTFTSRSNMLDLTMRSKYVQIGGITINNVEMKNFNRFGAAFGTLSLGEVAWINISESDTTSYGLDDISFFTKMADDTIATRIVWDDKSIDDRNKALIETLFHPHEGGGIFIVDTASILFNDSLWTVTADNFVDINRGRIQVSKLKLAHKEQSLEIDGYAPMSKEDTLSVRLNRFDISMLDFLTASKGFDVDGLVTGQAKVANAKNEPMFLADLGIEGLGFNGEHFGDATVKSDWNRAKQAVNVDVGISTANTQSLSVIGTYYTNRKDNNLDFNIKMDSLRLAMVSAFTAGQISRMQGFGNGNVAVTGSVSQPQLNGTLSIVDGGCKVTYLNTYYSFSPTFLLDSKTIEIKDMVLVDTLGNKASVEGKIYHDFLKNFRLDLRLHPRDFLAMATTLKDNDSFYGNVVTNGLITVKGPVNDISLDIKAMTRNGTQLTLPLNRVSTVRENDFIVFVNHAANEEEEKEEEQLKVKKKSNFSINLDMNVTDGAGVKIMLPGDIGTLDAKGRGDIKLATSSTENLSMYGSYVINEGHFLLNFKDLVIKNFNLKSGGTIHWSGSPTDGRINATAAYTVKTSLSTLGVQIDSTAMGSGNNVVNAECLIHLKDALLNPTITFGLNLPNASEDTKQTVYTLIDTTNQSVMTNQALSLLMLGAFSNVGSDGGASFGSLTNLLGGGVNFDLGQHFDLGLKYYSGSGYHSYDEMQMALKMEFFENRLIIETNVGMLTESSNSQNASNFVGEVDARYKLSEDGNLMAHFYNHSNYNANYSRISFDRLAPYTQGLGLTYSVSFDKFSDLFKRKKGLGIGQPLLNRTQKKESDNP